MKAKAKVFDKLREALRIAMPEGKNGLNDDGDETDIKTIEKKVTEFRDWLESDEKRKETYLKMIEQMDKYWEKLFADPLVVNTPQGQTIITPQRTNNILERFFRGEKRRNRKKSGTASLNKTLKTILADTPLVRNLENEEYLNIILNGCSTLAERFSQIDDKIVREELKEAGEKSRKNTTGGKVDNQATRPPGKNIRSIFGRQQEKCQLSFAHIPESVKPLRIPQRYITRPAHDSELYRSVTAAEFKDLKRNKKFCLTWRVYHTDYGVPSIVLEWLNRKHHVVVNVSREIIPQARRLIPNLKAIFVSVPLEISMHRMISRRRETENERSFQQRLQRAKENQTLKGADFIVDNSGSLDMSAKKLLSYLLSFG